LPDGRETLARFAGARLGEQHVVEIFPKLFMLPQVNDGGRLLAAFIHHESDSAHGNNLAEKCAEVNFNLTTKAQRHEEKIPVQRLTESASSIESEIFFINLSQACTR
jgi:hypothetical protein